jgi:hypothetical protein
MKKILWIVPVIALVAGFFETARAQTPNELYVPETGHWIRGEFLKFYQSADDPLLIFGYPITEEFVDPSDNTQTQYFQRARFDLVNTNNGVMIQLAPLGLWERADGAQPAPFSTNSPTCRLFTTTGKSVCYAFLQFYDAHNGPAFFGEPISEAEIRDERIVQYFEHVRMEWRAEKPAGQRVTLTDLGRMYFDQHVGDQNRLLPVAPSNKIIANLTHLQTHAFVTRVLAPSDSDQTVFIIVQDQNFSPIEGAISNVIITLPDGSQEIYRAPASNKAGFSSISFAIHDMPVKEIVQIDVETDYLGFKSNAETWFRIWW